MIAIIPERVIGMPRNTDRHRPESARTPTEGENCQQMAENQSIWRLF
jgi:hypothetical protein